MNVQEAIFDDKSGYNPERLTALISPEAGKSLEQMAQRARQITRQRFGNVVQLYAPLYVSNYCVNSCPYCAFGAKSDLPRKRLTIEQACKEADILADEGFRHILIVSGEDKEFITVSYLLELSKELRKKFSSISIEIYPLNEPDYRNLFDAGIEGIAIYQETYDKADYSEFHKTGPKADYDWRFETLQRAAQAGFRSLGLGFLIGISDWRTQTMALAEHANFLIKKYWQARVSFSFPRLRPAENVDEKLFKYMITDAELAQMMISLRLCFPDGEIVLSTREKSDFRDNMAQICVTRMSAGSRTSPGGYSEKDASLKQFEIADNRSPAQAASMLESKGLQAVWKDWDAAFAQKDLNNAGL